MVYNSTNGSKMAARTDAAAHGSSFRCSFLYFLYFIFVSFGAFVSANNCYTRQDLVDIGYRHKISVSSDFHYTHNIPDDIARPPGAPWIVIGSGRRRRRRRERKQKRGCRSGLMLKLRRQPHRPPLPSLYLSNARSMVNKTDNLELELAGNRYVRDCCVMIITETWLHRQIPDASVQLAGRTLLRGDRTKNSEQKTITAESGQNVTLPRRAPNNNILGVDWSRADLEEEYVLLYRDGHFDSANQHPSFKDRVDLQDRQMKDGDVSLILKNVTVNDTGTYKYRLQQSRTNRRKRAVYDNDPISNITLRVVAPPEKEVIQVNVTVGENVILPCKAPNNNSITVVELSRPDLDPECVFLYRDEWIDADSQNSRFKDRVELQDRHMKDGDVSVILKNVALNDTGTYECRVVQTTTNRRKRGVDPISIIYLRVAPPGPTGGPGRLRGGLSVSALLLVAAVGFILIYRKHKQQQSHGLYQPRAEL